MKKRSLLKTLTLVAVAGIPVVLASVPRSSEIANDTAIYQNLREIRIEKIKSVNFDSDIQRLSAQEKAHHEALPLRISAPMDRIATTPYRSGKPSKKRPTGKPAAPAKPQL